MTFPELCGLVAVVLSIASFIMTEAQSLQLKAQHTLLMSLCNATKHLLDARAKEEETGGNSIAD